MRCKDTTALVTGGLKGIGLAIANRLAEEGSTVFITDIDKPSEDLNANINYINADVTNELDWKRVAQLIEDERGSLDILVNNAGVDCVGPVQKTSLKNWRRVMSINVDGAFLGVKHCYDILAKASEKRNGGASIVNISSMLSKVGYIDTSGYNASKGAISSFTKAIAVEFASKNISIRSNSVHPGFVHTPLLQQGMQNLVNEGVADSVDVLLDMLSEMTPIGRMAKPNEIANAVLFLASDESSYMVGSELVIDGGWTAR
ncbi:MAG: SDR family oxidoreductase [Hellea sp.]|jgi:NAD(P)-dependent dehydrogenase (short-subunit alcohol dehydrogenase family)|nr:SDR family oxidoreductase [Hellea sp.]MBT4995963.1 SDR family oxidoreductase [Hellea sp.]MBT5835975.1 SDR family oxidoreductase [Hellea sp.]MBT7397696.1 SDR family oxidoreductase [Hellea sp.]